MKDRERVIREASQGDIESLETLVKDLVRGKIEVLPDEVVGVLERQAKVLKDFSRKQNCRIRHAVIEVFFEKNWIVSINPSGDFSLIVDIKYFVDPMYGFLDDHIKTRVSLYDAEVDKFIEDLPYLREGFETAQMVQKPKEIIPLDVDPPPARLTWKKITDFFNL